MDIDDIKRNYSDAILDAMTVKDGSGRGWVCPVCGSGSGPKGTGLIPAKGKDGRPRPGYYHCFAAGCDFVHGDILELIGKTYHLPETVQQIQKAGELIHMDFTNKDDNRVFSFDKPIDLSDFDDKNTPENSDNEAADTQAKRQDIRAFMDESEKNLAGSLMGKQYLKRRGISEELAARFHIGFCYHYKEGMNTAAIIIPTGPDSYTARSIDTDDSGRKVRKGKAGDRAGVFGSSELDAQPPLCFIVEGELDALSIMEASGLPAVCTGGGTSKRELVEEIKRKNPATLFIIIPDNDRNPDGTPNKEKGLKAATDVYKAIMLARYEMPAARFAATGIKVTDAEIWPQDVKDCNEYLTKDRDRFTAFLQMAKDKAIETALGAVSGYMQDFINQVVGNTPPIPTGFFDLDEILEGGLHPGLIIVGAVSSLGKTTFCLNIADKLAQVGHDVLFYSLEMSKFELIAKIISRRTALACLKVKETKSLQYAKTNLGVSDFKRWETYNPDEVELLEQCMDDFETGAGKHLYIREGMQDIGPDEIRKDVDEFIRLTNGRRPVVIVDYIQILKTPDAHLTDKQKTDVNVVELKRLSRDYNIPVIGISSFNRDNYTQPVNMAAFKESGAVEYTSDVLIGLQFEGMDYRDGEKDGERLKRIRLLNRENAEEARQGKAVSIQAKVLKNRSGGKADCLFNYFPMFNLYLTNTEAELDSDN